MHMKLNLFLLPTENKFTHQLATEILHNITTYTILNHDFTRGKKVTWFRLVTLIHYRKYYVLN
jgi:hypothetical protein